MTMSYYNKLHAEFEDVDLKSSIKGFDLESDDL